MAPSDDPIANSDRTVGVRGNWDRGILKALKREALLFDQIAILDLDLLDRSLGRVSGLELGWLKDIGIVREGPLLLKWKRQVELPIKQDFMENFERYPTRLREKMSQCITQLPCRFQTSKLHGKTSLIFVMTLNR